MTAAVLGIIAGKDRYPLRLAQAARAAGVGRVVAVATSESSLSAPTELTARMR